MKGKRVQEDYDEVKRQFKKYLSIISFRALLGMETKDVENKIIKLLKKWYRRKSRNRE